MTHGVAIPELAGLGSYQEAARIGFPVDETVARLLRYQWLERAVLRTLVAHLPATPEWEAKCGMALLVWQSAEHVESVRQRIAEMRQPLPAVDTAPDPDLARFTDELLHARSTAELLAGVYQVVVRGLVSAYRDHLARANLLVDHPTRRVLRFALLELEEAAWWGEDALRALITADPAAAPAAEAWASHLDRVLAAAGGIDGTRDRRPAPNELRSAEPFRPDFRPRRDARFSGQHNFEFPPHVVYNDPSAPADERNLALLAKRTLEMDVPEMMATVMYQRDDLPWEFQRDYARQLWDEMRHAMMGTVAFEARGVEWRSIPLNVGFSLRLNLHATPLERQVVLYAIEQSLMPGETGKRYEYQTARDAGDPLSEHFHDYDWADEVLHARIGRRWLKHQGIDTETALARGREVHTRTWAELARYRDEPQTDWWDDFVREVLGRPSAVPAERRTDLRIMAE